MAKVNTGLTTADLQALVATMYSRPLTREEVDTLLENTSTLRLVYRSMHGGLDIYDYDAPMHRGPVLSLAGRGEVTEVESPRLREILGHAGNAAIIYPMFESGVLTLEYGEIKQQLAAENLVKQRNAKLNKNKGNI